MEFKSNKIKLLIQVSSLVLIGLLFLNSAKASSSESEEGGFKAGEMIMHHISDAHEIHFIGDVALYLPVILSTDDGFKVFSSSHFYHNEQHVENVAKNKSEHFYSYDGFVMHHEHIYYADENGSLSFNEKGEVANRAVTLDLSITKNVFGLFFTIFLMFLIFFTVAKGYKKRGVGAPKGIQSFIEPLILFIRDEVARPSIGKQADRFMPFLLTVFFFIWISNLLGLIPFLGGLNITGTLSITMVLAVFVFILISFKANKHYWMHILWPPGVPAFVKVILVPIEIAGIFIKPIVLMVRLTANITAGHIIILSFVSLIFIFGQQSVGLGYGVGVGATLFMIFMNFIELLVAFLQAYVFTLLSAIYFGSAVEEPHH